MSDYRTPTPDQERDNSQQLGQRIISDAPRYNGETALPPRPNNQIRPITIEPLDHGYIVGVGCQRFAIENASMLVAKLSEYLNDPVKTEGKWAEGKLF